MFLNLDGCGVSGRPVNEMSCQQPKACTCRAEGSRAVGLSWPCMRGDAAAGVQGSVGAGVKAARAGRA